MSLSSLSSWRNLLFQQQSWQGFLLAFLTSLMGALFIRPVFELFICSIITKELVCSTLEAI